MPSGEAIPNLFPLKLTPAQKLIGAHTRTQHHQNLVNYLRSGKEITLELRWYLADVLEKLAYPKRGAPHKSIQGKYEYLASKKEDVAAVVANEIVRQWRKNGCRNHSPEGKPINRSACQEAIAALKAWCPEKFTVTNASRVEQRMKAVSEYKFPILWDHLVGIRGAK
jgi:hypothetical protein